VTFTLWNSYVLKLLRLETLTFSDVTLSDINVVCDATFCRSTDIMFRILELDNGQLDMHRYGTINPPPPPGLLSLSH
jgi:hypothetical protein